jgi:hypothetical protein
MPPWRSRQSRAGHYRVSYESDDQARLVTVLHVRHRKDVYRNKSSEPGGTLRRKLPVALSKLGLTPRGPL